MVPYSIMIVESKSAKHGKESKLWKTLTKCMTK